MDIFLYSNTGGKEKNEDSVGYKTGDDRSLFVIADGLGGHQLGGLASKCAVHTLLNGWSNYNAEQEEPEDWLLGHVSMANDAILKMQEEYQCTIKTTLTVLLLEDEYIIWANSGDSRLYYFHDRRLQFVTEDHSVAYKKYKAGEITREQIGMDVDQSSLLRSLGGKERYEPDVHRLDGNLEPGDSFFLCTDGVWEYLQDEEILIDLLKAETAKEWAELLLLRIMDRIQDGNDNLTMLAIMIE